VTDAPGEGFEVGAGYISVSPEGEDFQEEVKAIVGETDIVVQVPVVPDAGDFRAALEEQVGAGETAVTVPVVPDTAGFRLLLEDGVAGSGAQPVTVPVVPDAEGFAAKVDAEVAGADKPVEVPVTPDMAGFAETADADARAAGETAGATFSESFSSVASRAQLFGTSDAELDAAAGTAGEAAGVSWRERFAAAANTVPDLEGLAGAADAEAGAAGEAAGVTFSERFAAIASRAQALAGSAASFAAVGAEDGEAAGAGFIGRMKETISGGMGSIEFLLGAGFVAATAVMANSFQEAMERIHTQAGVGQGSIAGLSNDVLDLASKVGESPSSLAQALYHVESAFQSTGISGQKAMQLLQTAAEGARVGGSDLTDTTNALDAIIVAGIPGIRNYGQAMGAVNAIVGSGDMTMQDFADAAGSGLFAVAKTYGQSLPQIGAALATFGDNNIRGAKAATDLRMAMQAIAEPVTTAGAALAHLGLQSTTLYHTMTEHGLTAAVGQLVERLKATHTPIADWGEYVTDIFGKRAGVGIGVLVDQLSRMQGKLGDITGATHKFGSAWEATEATTSQKLHNLEAGLEALMIRIGNGLLPYLDDIFTAITKALPKIEKWGAAFAKIASPTIKAFFSGLAKTLHLLFGPLKDITISVLAAVAAMLTISKVIGIVKAARTAFIALQVAMASNPWVLLAIAVAVLVGVIIKYHKQIWDFIKKTWHDIASFLESIAKPLFKPIEDAFSAFSGWWKSHGAEIKEVWNSAWNAISGVFKVTWDIITGIVSAAWQLVGPFISAGLSILEGEWEIVWAAISAYFKSVWDIMAAVVKIAWAAITAAVKIAWDLIVGLFDIFLDLITGHWSKAWDDAKTLVTQIWNAIKGFLGTTWHAISSLAIQIWNNIKGFLSSSWNTIKSTASSVFNAIRTTISNIWHGILSDIKGVVHDIESVIGGITSAPGKALSAVGGFFSHFAGGGVVPGYSPGRDSVRAMLSPGEGVLTPEAVRGLGGPGFVHAANAQFSGGRASMAAGGIVPSFRSPQRFAYGGIAGLDLGGPDGLQAVLEALVDALTGQGAIGAGGGSRAAMAQGATINMAYYGTQYPSVEQRQAILLDLQTAISNA
jgi:TP901 family phage tail tape measure protein